MYKGIEGRNSVQSIDYLTGERSPIQIATQTGWVINYLRHVKNSPIEHAQDYVREFSLPYLGSAVESADILFNDQALRSEDFDPDGEMAARHVYVVMAWMHEMMGFSRRGMLRAPSNRDEFTGRVRDMEQQLTAIAFNPGEAHSSAPNVKRWLTLSFLETASGLTELHLPEVDRESSEREREALFRLKEFKLKS